VFIIRIFKILTISISLILSILYLIGCGVVQPAQPQSSDVNATASTATTTSSSTALQTEGKTYYVSPSGNDSNPGTIDQPFKTIQHAADIVVAGETVLIRDGVYNEHVEPANSGDGTAGYIVFSAYPDEKPIIDGDGISVPEFGGLFDVSGKSYIKITGLRVINSEGAGIFAEYSSYIIIEKNYTNNTVSSGIGIWNSNNIIIDNNEVELACNDGEQECITVAGTNIFEVKNNHVYNGGPGTHGGEGIDAKDGSYDGAIHDNNVHNLNGRLGIYVDAWDKHTYDIEVFSNIVHDIEGADGFTISSEAGCLLEDVTIYNNIAYNNGLSGLTFSSCCEDLAAKHPVKDVKVINNTFYNNGSGTWGGGVSLENPDAQNIVIRNNILSQNLIFQIQVEVPVQNLTVEYNLIDGYRGYSYEIYGRNYVVGDPMFVNPSESDFHLLGNSPAIDRGSPIDAPINDFDGNTRPQGSGYDIGAYEVVK